MIHLAGRVLATTTDLLNGTRLQSPPANGVLIVQFCADLNNATNNYTCTIELPDGDTPVNGQSVSGSNPSLGGTMDSRLADRYEFPVTQGGHVTITLTETGTAILYFKITFVF